MQEPLALWTRIVGILLIVLGLTLMAAPEISYRRREKVLATPSLEITAKRERVMVVPRAVAVLIIGFGIVVLIIAGKNVQR